MSDARIIHKKASGGERVCLLNHLEHRVWVQYVLSSDDYGVMRYSVSGIRHDNPRLEEEPLKKVEAALRRVVDVELVRVFDHQGKLFLWQPDWNDWQQVKYPRLSVNPAPSSVEIAANATKTTRELFEKHPQFTNKRFLENEETFSSLACAGGRETLTLTQTPTSEESLGTSKYSAEFEQFWRAYPNRTGKGDAFKAWQALKPTTALIDAMVAALGWQVNQPGWVKDGGKFIPHPATWIRARRWEDEPFHAVDDSDAAFERVVSGNGRLQ